MKNYDEIIYYSNLDIAICDIVSKKKGIYHDFFGNFESFIKEKFLENYDKFVEFATKKKEEFAGGAKPIKTQYYVLNIALDYTKVLEKLETCKALLS